MRTGDTQQGTRSVKNMAASLDYVAPESSELNEDHVRAALDFLVAVEPKPAPESRDEYEGLTRPHRGQIVAAMTTLRSFAEQAKPVTLEQMQSDYYGFTNDPRYLVSSGVSAIVRGSLNDAWDGVGPWRR